MVFEWIIDQKLSFSANLPELSYNFRSIPKSILVIQPTEAYYTMHKIHIFRTNIAKSRSASDVSISVVVVFCLLLSLFILAYCSHFLRIPPSTYTIQRNLSAIFCGLD